MCILYILCRKYVPLCLIASSCQVSNRLVTKNNSLMNGIPNTPEESITIDAILSDFGEFLGKGTLGTVHALKSRPNEAVKEIRTDGFLPATLERLKESLNASSSISHPNILKYLWVLYGIDFIYIGMKRYPSSLSSLIIKHKREKKQISEDFILLVIRQAASALAYLHDSSKENIDGRTTPLVVHQNLTSDNILANVHEMHIVIADLGLCHDDLRGEYNYAYNSAYMAPEVTLEKRYSPASDIWSLGIIIYELATLSRPNFIKNNNPTNALTEDCKIDLSLIKSKIILRILESILVSKPEERISALQIIELLDEHDNLTDNQSEKTLFVNNLIVKNTALIERCDSLETSLSKAVSQNQALVTEIESLKARCNDYASKLLECNNELAMLRGSSSTVNSIHSFVMPTKLMLAVRNNDIDTVKTLVSSDTDIGKCDEERMTALMIAAQQGYTDAVRLLADKEHGAQDINGRTALMHAATHGHLHAVEILLKHEKGVRDKGGQTALLLALNKGYVEVTNLLLEHEASDLGWTNLISGAVLGDVEMVKSNLHEKGKRDAIGLTALMWAIRRGNVDVVRVLAEHEAEVPDLSGRAAIMYATATENDALLEPLLKRTREATGWTPLMCAAAAGDIDTAKQYLNDRDIEDANGDTALIVAAKAGHKDLVELLDPTDDRGVTALMRSTLRDDIKTLVALLPLQSKLKTTANGDYMFEGKKIKFDAGSTALMFAVRHDKIQAVKELAIYEGGIQNDSNYTALMYATWANNPEIVSILLNKEAGFKSNYGYTALMYASKSSHSRIVSLLLEREAGMKNNKGSTALMQAAECGHTQIISLLKEKEATMQDNYGCTALMRAVYKGKTEAVALLADCEKGIKMTSKWCRFQPGTTALAIAQINGNQKIIDILSVFPEEECEDHIIYNHPAMRGVNAKPWPSKTDYRAKKADA